jgi:hypothetical protein
MPSFEYELPRLADRVGAGDSRAALELKHELQAQMPRIVRRAMRPSAAASSLTQWVRAAAQRQRNDAGSTPADPDQLVNRIALDLCESVMGRLQTGRLDAHPLLETLRT